MTTSGVIDRVTAGLGDALDPARERDVASHVVDGSAPIDITAVRAPGAGLFHAAAEAAKRGRANGGRG